MIDDQDDFPIINPDDFKSIQVAVQMINVTTNTQVRAGERVYGEVVLEEATARIMFLEFFEEGMFLEVPRPSCQQGHTVQLEIRVHGAKQDLRFEVKAKVEGLERLNENRDRVKVHLTDYDNVFWEAFKSVFTSRQKEIEDFFFAAKGQG